MENYKYVSFEYIINQLIAWQSSINQGKQMLFTRLQILKLLFFVAAVRKDNNDNGDLLDIFDNFYAMQHGPVESDIYSKILSNGYLYYDFEDRIISRKNCINRLNTYEQQPSESLCKRIDCSINLLKLKNPNIVTYSATDLVNLSHRWGSWQMAMHIATAIGKGSQKMDINAIRSDNQYFNL